MPDQKLVPGGTAGRLMAEMTALLPRPRSVLGCSSCATVYHLPWQCRVLAGYKQE